MKRLLLCCVILFGLSMAAHAVTFSNGNTCIQNTNTSTTCAAAVTVGSGDAGVLVIAMHSTSNTNSVSDTCGQTWTHQTGASGNLGTTANLDVWTYTGGVAGTCTVTVTRTVTGIKFAWAIADYSSVSSIGNVTATNSGTSTTASSSTTTQDNNNVVVGAFELNQVVTPTASVGTLRETGSNTATFNPQTVAITDNTSGSPASVTNTITWTGSGGFIASSLELRNSGVSGRAAVSSDMGTLVEMNCGAPCNYTLPSTPPPSISGGSNWNTTVIGYGAQTYQITVQAPALINGQSSAIVLPRYAMVRVFTDGTNYFVSAPITAGTGLTTTPSATGFAVGENTATMHVYANTVRLTADSSSITATTAATATVVFTLPTLSANTNYSFHCAGTTSQATAGAGIGIAIQATVNSPTSLSAYGHTATTTSAIAFGSQVGIANTTAFSVLAPGTGTLTTAMPYEIDGSVQVGASVPTINLEFYTANASDAVTVKKDSFCTVMP